METSIVRISPSIATEMLSRNKLNRNVSTILVKKYAQDMAGGHWRLTGQGISFDKDGYLLDGQHRLNAIISCGGTVDMLVIIGLDPDIRPVLDTGRKRTAADVLSMNGCINSTKVASAIKLVILYDAVKLRRINDRTYLVNNYDVLDFWKEHKDIEDSGRMVANIVQGLVAPSIALFWHYIFQRISPAMADDFINMLASGANLPINHPVLILRNKLIKIRTGHMPMHPTIIMCLGIKAWNLFRDHKTCKILSWGGFHEKPEPLPVAK